jgi:hypothetical protein
MELSVGSPEQLRQWVLHYILKGGGGDQAGSLQKTQQAAAAAAGDTLRRSDAVSASMSDLSQHVISMSERVIMPNSNIQGPSVQNSAFTTDKQMAQKTFGKRYKDLQLTETHEDFISELKKWSLAENEDALIQAFGDVKGGTKMTDDYKKYREEYKELQKLYIKDFNDGFSQFIEVFPFRRKDFSYLTGLKNSLDGDDDKAYVSDSKIDEKTIKDLKILKVDGQLGQLTNDVIDRFLSELDNIGKIDLNSDSLISRLLNKSGINISSFEDDVKYALEGKGFGQTKIYTITQGGDEGIKQIVNFTPNIRAIGNRLREFLEATKGGAEIKIGIYDTLLNLTSQYIKLKELNAELKRKYEPLKKEIDDKINKSQSKDKELQLTDVKYKPLLAQMCGRKAANFWYGGKDMKVDKYEELKRFFEENELLFFPFYDLKLLKALNNHRRLRFTDTPAAPAQSAASATDSMAQGGPPKQARFKVTYVGPPRSSLWPRPATGGGFQRGGSAQDFLEELEELSPEKVEYMQEVLPLFDLLNPGQTKKQGDEFEITQLMSQNNLLSNTSLNITGENIWQAPKDKQGLDILSPIQLLKIKKGLMEKARDFYNMERSINADLEFKKQYEKELSKDSKKLTKEEKQKQKDEKKALKEEKKAQIEEKKREIEAKKNELINQKESGTITDQQIAQKEKEIAQEEKQIQQQEKQIEEQEDLDIKEQQLEQKEQELEEKEKTTDLSQDKLYTKKDVSKASSELDKLKMEMKRKENILESISKNIKLLKSQSHGDDSEQRQLQNREYEKKYKELILFKKLVEQREEKLKVIKILTDKLTEKDELERSEMLRRNEIEKQKNFLSLQREMNNITEKQSKEMNESVSGIKGEEINKLKNKLSDLEDDETHIQREIVQNGGGNRKDDKLNRLLYKTESRKNRTKKKGRKARGNERKKDRSLRKRA